MPFRRYRLAAPIGNNQLFETTTLVLYRPTSSRPLSNRSQLVTSTDTNTRTKLVLPDDTEEVKYAASPPRWWLVLPPLALIMFVTAANPLLLNDLFEYREQQSHGSHGSKIKQDADCQQSRSAVMPMHYWPFPLGIQQSSREQSGHNGVQKEVSQLNIKNALATLFPSLFIFILLGSNCDNIGRRPLIFLPFVGKIIYNSLFLIIVSYDLSNTWLIIIHALDAGFGSHGLVVVGALAYISDCSVASERTRAFLIVEIILVVMRVTPMLAVGLYWRRYQHLYVAPLSIFLVLSVIGLIYAMFIQPESITTMQKHSLVHQLSLVRLKPIQRIFTTFAAKRSGNNRKKLILITLVIILFLVVHFGYASMYILYLYGRPFCMNALSISLLACAQALLILLLTLVAVRFKQQIESTYLPSMIGALALIIDLFLFGLAKVVWLLYVGMSFSRPYTEKDDTIRRSNCNEIETFFKDLLDSQKNVKKVSNSLQFSQSLLTFLLCTMACVVPQAIFFSVHSYFFRLLYIFSAVCIGSLYFVTQPVLRSKVTKLVRENEYAVVFIAVGIIESVGHQAVGLLSNTIYKVSLRFFPGLVFLVFALVGLAAVAIMGYLYFVDSKKSSNTYSKTNATPSADDNT